MATAAQLLEFDASGKFIREIGKNLYAWSYPAETEQRAHSRAVVRRDHLEVFDLAFTARTLVTEPNVREMDVPIARHGDQEADGGAETRAPSGCSSSRSGNSRRCNGTNLPRVPGARRAETATRTRAIFGFRPISLFPPLARRPPYGTRWSGPRRATNRGILLDVCSTRS
jgi:hypothetical protein